MSSKLGQIQPWTAELAALDQLKKIFNLLENYLKILASSQVSDRFPLGYLYVSGSESITSFGEERELICQLLFTCNYVVSVRGRSFLFLWVLRNGCVILLWHSLSLPYDVGCTRMAKSCLFVSG